MLQPIYTVAQAARAGAVRLATSTRRITVSVAGFIWHGPLKGQVERHARQFEPQIQSEVIRWMALSEGKPLAAFWEALTNDSGPASMQSTFQVAMAIVDSPFCGLERRWLRADCDRKYRESNFAEGTTPIIIAVQANRIDVLDALISKGVDVNATDIIGCNALRLAVMHTNVAATELLLLSGAKPNDSIAETASGFTTAHLAAQTGNVTIFLHLVANGASINAVNRLQQSLLHNSASYGHTGVSMFLLAHDAPVNAVDYKQKTPLHNAANYGRVPMTELLLAYGADVGAVDVDLEGASTPLHIAAATNEFEVLQLLLDNGSDIDGLSKVARTPLHLAALVGNVRCISILLAEGASPIAVDEEGVPH